MMHKDYLTRVRNDLLSRLNGGRILINDSVSVPVQSTAISSHPLVGFQDAIALQVQAPRVSVPVIHNLKLLTEDGVIVSEKTAPIAMNGAQFLTLTFVVQVKGAIPVMN